MKRIFILLSILFFSVVSLWGQTYLPLDSVNKIFRNSKNFLWDRGSSFTSQNNLFREIDFSSYELLSANLTFTDEDQAQKIVMSPFRFTSKTDRFGALINTKINIALNEKITTIGIGFGGDNSLYYTKRAARIRDRYFNRNNIPLPGVPSTPDLNYELYLQEIVAGLTNTQVTDSLKALFHIKEQQLIFEKYNKEVLNRTNTIFDSLLLLYDKAVAMNIVRWSVGYNIQLFPNLFAQGLANNFDSLNHFNLKSHNISGTITFSHNNNSWVITATYNQIYARTSAEKLQKTVPYYGPSFSVSKRLFSFVPQSVLDTMSSYRKSLFVPSLNFGFGYEGKYADGASKYVDFYQDKVKSTISWMPFVDILISPALQFRIGMPITCLRYPTGEKQVYAGANVQYNFKLSNLPF